MKYFSTYSILGTYSAAKNSYSNAFWFFKCLEYLPQWKFSNLPVWVINSMPCWRLFCRRVFFGRIFFVIFWLIFCILKLVVLARSLLLQDFFSEWGYRKYVNEPFGLKEPFINTILLRIFLPYLKTKLIDSNCRYRKN